MILMIGPGYNLIPPTGQSVLSEYVFRYISGEIERPLRPPPPRPNSETAIAVTSH